jgi:hypothetical protein
MMVVFYLLIVIVLAAAAAAASAVHVAGSGLVSTILMVYNYKIRELSPKRCLNKSLWCA